MARRTVSAVVAVAIVVLAGLAPRAPSWAAQSNPDAVAVVIGNKDYVARDIPDVDFAHRDADAIKGYLVQVMGFRPDNIIDLRDASKADLEGALGNWQTHKGRLFRKTRAGRSDVVVFYSGHGVPDPENKTPFLLPVNVKPQDALISGYSLSLLYRNLAKLEARSALVLLDTCFSGISHAGSLMGDSSPVYVQAAATVPRGITVFSAAGPRQVATWDRERRHGLFTAHFLDAAKGLADRPQHGGNGDGAVMLREIKSYLDRSMTPAAMNMHGREQQASLTGDHAKVLTRLAAAPALPNAQTVEAEYIAIGKVSLRAGPSRDSPRLAFIEANTKVWVSARVGQWLRVELEDQPVGYVYASRLQALHAERPSPPPAPQPPATALGLEPIDAEYVALKNANVRDRPSVAGDRIATLPKGSRIAVLGRVKNSDWYAIELGDGRRAYVYRQLLADPSRSAGLVPAKPGGATPAPSPAPAPKPQPAFQPSYGTGVADYGRKDYESALRHFRPLAEKGHADAQNYIGYMHRHGQGVAVSNAEALRWYRAAATQGHASARYNLGYMYDTGTGVTRDYDAARKWYELAAKQGSQEAQNSLGYLYRMGHGVAKDFDKAVFWYRKAVAQNFATARVNLGAMYYYGHGVAKDLEEARRLFQKAHEQGNKSAKKWLDHLAK